MAEGGPPEGKRVKAQMDLTVIIVTYNSGPNPGRLLADLAREAEILDLEVMVIDNASTDGFHDTFRAEHPWARFRENACNLGFARACNQGLRQGRGRYLMLLNPDTRVKAGCLRAMVDYLDESPEVGAVGPKILNPDGTIQLSARSKQGPEAFLFNRYSLLTRLWPSNVCSRRYLLSDWDHDSVREVDWLSGAALMVRREAIERAGLMDERFFLFHEDVDWCQRIKAEGLKVVFYDRAEVFHEIGISKNKASLRLLQIRHRSMILYVHKYYRRWGPLLWLADLAIGLRFGLLAASNLFRKSC